jgi:aspartyl protease family protein
MLVAPSLRIAPTPSAPVAAAEARADDGHDRSKPTTAAATALGNGFASQELSRSPDGHFYAEAQVNGARITFMIDTGASMVALTPADAQRAGISLGSERARAQGAGGAIEVIPVTIDRIAIGSLAASQVRGAVVEELSVSLLGQSFLERADRVEIAGDRMVIR